MRYNDRMFKCRRALIFALFALIAFSNAAKAFAMQLNAADLRDGWVELSGKWDFFKQELKQPYDFYPKGKTSQGVQVSLPFNMGKDGNFGTFHIRARGLVPNKYYATEIYGALMSSSRIWCNGKLVATSGFLSKDFRDARSGECCELVELPADQNGIIDLVIHVADFYTGDRGILKPIRLTEKKNVLKFFHLNYFLNTFVLFFLLAHIVYNMTLMIMSFKRSQHLILIFLCLSLAASTLLTGISLTQKLMPMFPYWFHRKLPVALFCLEAALVVFYEASLFKFPLKKIAPVLIFNAANTAAAFIVPYHFFEKAKYIFTAIAILSAFFSLDIPSPYVFRKRPGESAPALQNMFLRNARIFATYIVMIMCVWDFLVTPQTQTSVHYYILYKFSILIFGMVQCWIYSFNRNWTLARVQRYSKALADDNDTLSKFVSDRILSLMGASDITKIIPGEGRIVETMIVCVQIKHYDYLVGSVERKELFNITLEFYKSISPIILDSGGFIAKHTTGGCIALFQQKNTDAIICAARIQKKIKEIRRRLRRSHRTDITVGISIHSGKAAIGTMGTNYRLDTAAISDDISLAYSVARQNSKLNSQILITEEAMPYCRNYIDYMYEGHFFILDGKQILVYSAMPIVKKEVSYEETLEAIEGEEELDEI